ncbi:MAG: amino acid permease [Ignavibacteriaceae bacterium]
MENINPKRELNLLQIAAIIIGAVIGSGVFLNIPIVADIAGSPGLTIVIWILGGVLWLPQILILAELSTAYPNQGGPYYYIHKAGSPYLAFQYTWTAFLTSDTPSLTIIALIASSAISFFFPFLADTFYGKMFAASLILVFTVIQYRSVKLGGNVQVILTISKLLPLLGIVFVGLSYIGSNLSFLGSSLPGSNSLFNKIVGGVSATIWAYAGFMNILYMGGEIKNPVKNLPRALIGSIIFVIFTYALIAFSTFMIVPFENVVASKGEILNPFIYIPFVSDISGSIFSIVIFISMLGVLNSIMMAQPRLEYAMAKDGLFFPLFGKLHPKYLTPHYSIVIQATIAILLLFLGDVESLLGYFTISYTIQNSLVYGSIISLRKKEEYIPAYKIKFPVFLAILSILIQIYFSFGAFIAFPLYSLLVSMGFIAIGTPLYFYFYKYHSPLK